MTTLGPTTWGSCGPGSWLRQVLRLHQEARVRPSLLGWRYKSFLGASQQAHAGAGSDFPTT